MTPLELFFDLVFVFAFTQVTTVLSDNPTWSGLAHGLLILGALWWAWASYAWLTNTVDPNVGAVWGAMLVAMAAMFGAALTVPDAFGGHGVLFGVFFLIVTVMHLTLYALAARGDADLLTAILRIAPSALTGAALIIVAGFVDGELATIPALGLCGGPALYLFAYVALRARVSRTLGGGRLIAAIACALLWPVALVVPALAALALVATVWIGLHAYELIWWREARERTRALRAPAS